MDFFKQAIGEICAHSLVSPGKELYWALIVNPSAGGFTIRSRWKKHFDTLNQYRQKARENAARNVCGSGFFLTDAKGSAFKITQELIGTAEKNTSPFYLVITAGGDGTSLETLSAIYAAPASVRSRMAVLRLPMGTGNDGADHPTLAGALDLLIKPAEIRLTPAVRLIASPSGPIGNKPFLAFNIISMGLDAFVTHMTNKMKTKMPGDSYKLWVDIAALMYDMLYKVDYSDVRMFDDQNREILTVREKLLLLAMGASGGRTYGAGSKILPDSRNVCGIKQMALHKKIIFKSQVTSGKHSGAPFTIMLNASRVQITCKHPILAQMDGESVLLNPDDFPVSIELTQPVIPVFALRQA